MLECTNTPLVSVILPAYNHEDYVQDSIQSIINQTYENIELLVIDDGSKDSTWQKILKMKPECVKRFSNVVFETQSNKGTCATMNSMVSRAQGKYLFYTASDDLAKSTAIQKQVEFLEKNSEYVLCVGDSELISGSGQRIYWDEKQNIVCCANDATYTSFIDFYKTKRQDVDFLGDSFGSYNSLCVGNYIPGGFLIPRKIFEKIGMYSKDAPLEDYWLVLQLAKYGKFKFFNEIFYSYRWHSSNTSHSKKKMVELTKKTLTFENTIRESSAWRHLSSEAVLSSVRVGIKNIIQIEKSITFMTIKYSLFTFNMKIFYFTLKRF